MMDRFRRIIHRGLAAAFLGLVACAAPLATGTVGCAEPSAGDAMPTLDIEILDVAAPTPTLPGSLLVVDTRGLPNRESARSLRLTKADGSTSLLSEVSSDRDLSATELTFEVTASTLASLGTGNVAVDAVLVDLEGESPPFTTSMELASELAIALSDVPSGTHFRNDEVVFTGAGFLEDGEGSVLAEFVGDFSPASGAPERAVLARLPVRLAEQGNRSRGLVALTTDIGGLEPGTFNGNVTLESTTLAGATTRSSALDTSLQFTPPALFSYAPANPFLGQIVEVRGGGFLGASSEADEATLLRFDGEITLPDGTTRTLTAQEAVTNFVDGQTVEFGVDVRPDEEMLVSSFFGVQEGLFQGTVTPIVIKGTQDLTGDPVPVEIQLRGVRQVVQVRFLPGFYDSLRLFGLAAAGDVVVERAVARMESIYTDYNVDFVTEEPGDVLPSAFAVTEIGGPDPNGLGLFGYDNTPGKDIGNLRLFDSIGGANAETQADNYPGYGGVFIESFLFWSEDPGIGDGSAGPNADPLFDEIFDPVRNNPATLEEVRGNGDPERVAQVERAIDAIANIIGETASHEVGHSFGLAQPFGSPTSFHSAVPGEGCLMDGGADRPFGERAGQPGYAETRFCDDETEYLEEILPLP